MKLNKSRIFLIAVLGLVLGYQIVLTVNKDKVEPFPYNDTEMGQIRPGFYK